MAEKTGIAWTDHTFNPWWGCVKVSPGCEHCYAEIFANRTGHDIWGPAKTTKRRLFNAKHWAEPLKWNDTAEARKQRARVFCASMADVFEDHPQVVEAREDLWALIRLTPWLDWQILTKRPENIRAMLPKDWDSGFSNVWLGTSAEDQKRLDERLPELLKIRAHVHFLSGEPLLGPLNLTGYVSRNGQRFNAGGLTCALDWVIVGGESGGHRRPMEIEWLRSIVTQAKSGGAAVFVKQDNAFKPDQRGRIPNDLWVREFPETNTPFVAQRPKDLQDNSTP